jgi:hypothetical protein
MANRPADGCYLLTIRNIMYLCLIKILVRGRKGWGLALALGYIVVTYVHKHGRFKFVREWIGTSPWSMGRFHVTRALMQIGHMVMGHSLRFHVVFHRTGSQQLGRVLRARSHTRLRHDQVFRIRRPAHSPMGWCVATWRHDVTRSARLVGDVPYYYTILGYFV